MIPAPGPRTKIPEFIRWGLFVSDTWFPGTCIHLYQHINHSSMGLVWPCHPYSGSSSEPGPCTLDSGLQSGLQFGLHVTESCHCRWTNWSPNLTNWSPGVPIRQIGYHIVRSDELVPQSGQLARPSTIVTVCNEAALDNKAPWHGVRTRVWTGVLSPTSYMRLPKKEQRHQ